MTNEIINKNTPFFTDIATLLQNARSKAYRAVNSIMVETYWKIGERIVKEEQNGKSRAGYGEKLIENLSRYLTDTFGNGFSEANLQNFRGFFCIRKTTRFHAWVSSYLRALGLSGYQGYFFLYPHFGHTPFSFKAMPHKGQRSTVVLTSYS